MKLKPEERSLHERLFREVFHEDPSFCRRIFSHRLEEVFHKREQGEIVSFLYAIPFEAKVKGKSRRAVYVYGVGTVEQARGKGYMKEVFQSMEAHYKDQVDFYYLVPASESLFSLYETIGYQTGFFLKKELLFPTGNPSLSYEVSDGRETFHKDYLKFVSAFDTAIIRTKEDSDFYLSEGTYLKIGESGFYTEENRGVVHLRESYAKTPETMACFLDYLASKGKEKVIVTLPEQKTPYAMVKIVNPELSLSDFFGGYTNLNFD